MSAGHDGGGTRRDFLYIATGAAAATAGVGVVIPMVSQLAPNAREVAAGAPIELDISAIEPGQQVVVTWRAKPYFVRHLTDAEVKAAEDAAEGEFIEFAKAGERIATPEGATSKFAIVGASCTHLGCIPTKVDAAGLNGWICPCHGSKFDVTGRVTKGPAPINLPLPPYVFASDAQLIIGTDKVGA